MANVRVHCPTCNAELEIDDRYLGQEVECGSCLETFVAEEPKKKNDLVRLKDDEFEERRPRRRRSRWEDDDDDYRPRRYHDGIPPKSRLAYILLALFIGGLGIHNFYVGRTGAGIGQLCLFFFNITMIVFGACTMGVTLILAAIGLLAKFIWVVVEIIVVTEDGDGRPMA
jgi:predicted Zn finger-like uncharacterized protein